MKTLIIVPILFLLPFYSNGQVEDYKGKLIKFENLYSFALTIYCDSVTSDDTDSLLVEYEDLPKLHLPKMIGNISISLVSYEILLKLTSHKRSVNIIKVFPIESNNGEFSIGINSYRVSRNGKNIEYSLQTGMGIRVLYDYDCSSNSFILNDIE